jgi:hypothetical protein
MTTYEERPEYLKARIKNEEERREILALHYHNEKLYVVKLREEGQRLRRAWDAQAPLRREARHAGPAWRQPVHEAAHHHQGQAREQEDPRLGAQGLQGRRPVGPSVGSTPV